MAAGFSLEFIVNMVRNGVWTLQEAVQYSGGRYSARIILQAVQSGAFMGTEAAASTAVATTTGGAVVVGGAAVTGTTVAMIGIGLLIAILAVLGVSSYLGERAAETPVEFGAEKKTEIESMLVRPPEEREVLRKIEEPVVVRGVETEPYAIWLVGDRGEVIVGRKSVIEEQPSCSLVGWGLDPKKVKTFNPKFVKIGADYRTADEALKAYQEAFIAGSTRHLPLAMGTVGRFRFDGQEHRIDNALRFL